jgi:putative ABC transport system permease protein
VLKNSPVDYVKTFDEVRALNVSRPRFQMLLLGVFAALALLLATIGIYGVMSYSVTQRTHEIGIRMALGADARQVFALVLGHALKLALIGVVMGLAGAFAATRLMATLLYGVTPTDPITFTGVAALLVAVAALASFLPAWRAAKADPTGTLRSQL